MNWYFWSWRNC